MIHFDKDPTRKTQLLQEALKTRGLYTGEIDNWPGPRLADALAAFQKSEIAIPPAIYHGLHRDISADGLALIKHFEGLFLEAYLCPARVWTIGYGHTGFKHKDGTVHAGRKITEQEAEFLLRKDMDYFEGRVTRFITIDFNDDEFAALVSFDFNTGGLGDSTLRRLLNAGDRAGAAEQFLRWDKAGGKRLKGLTRRRQSERNLFLGKRPFLV
jgi:lysozyme